MIMNIQSSDLRRKQQCLIRIKAEIMAKSFAKSTENLTEEEKTMNQCPGVLERGEETGDVCDELFTLAEMMRAINGSRPTSPGKY